MLESNTKTDFSGEEISKMSLILHLQILRQGVPELKGPDCKSLVTFSLEPGLRKSQQSHAWAPETVLWLIGGAALKQYNWELSHEVLLR